MILAGDIGGTKVRLALFDLQNGELIRHETERFASSEFSNLEELIHTFLEKYPVGISLAAFGVPGPVINGIAKGTNLQWTTRADRLEKALGISKVHLVNDLVATAASVTFLSESDLLTLHSGDSSENDEMFAVLAPGTGLGQGFLFKHDDHHHVFASEGGHSDFAPTTEIEVELLQYLQVKFQRVSYERVLSGQGLVNIHEFLKATGKAHEPEQLLRRLQCDDPAAVITGCALAIEHEICVQALDIFASILGAQAGNIVLAYMATGGIYLGGGIPPKICEKLQDGTTVSAYLNKGRLSSIVKKTPLYVIRDDHAPLIGAASIAAKL